MLHSMTMRLIHVHQLETIYLCNEVKYQAVVIWGHSGQKVIFIKEESSPTECVAFMCDV